MNSIIANDENNHPAFKLTLKRSLQSLQKETLFEILSDKKATIQNLETFMKAIKFDQDFFENKNPEENDTSLYCLPT